MMRYKCTHLIRNSYWLRLGARGLDRTREVGAASCRDTARESSEMKSSTKDRAKGRAQELKGKIKEKAGRATGNRRTEDEGSAEKVGGTVRRKVGEVKKVFGG
jgi:uncharacterized protein YjbJ (UPF0337 family)